MLYNLNQLKIKWIFLGLVALTVIPVNAQESSDGFHPVLITKTKIGLDVPRFSIYGGLGPGYYDIKSEEVPRYEFTSLLFYQVGLRFGKPSLTDKRLYLFDISYKRISLLGELYDENLNMVWMNVGINELSLNVGITFLNMGKNSYFYLLVGPSFIFIPDITMDQKGESYSGIGLTLGSSIGIFRNFSIFIEGGADATITGTKYVAGTGEVAKSSGGILFTNLGLIYEIPF